MASAIKNTSAHLANENDNQMQLGRRSNACLHRALSRMCCAVRASLAKHAEQTGHEVHEDDPCRSARSTVTAPCEHRLCDARAASEAHTRARPDDYYHYCYYYCNSNIVTITAAAAAAREY